MLNELGGLAEGRGAATELQRTADAKATLQWIRSLRESRERHLGPPIKCVFYPSKSSYKSSVAVNYHKAMRLTSI